MILFPESGTKKFSPFSLKIKEDFVILWFVTDSIVLIYCMWHTQFKATYKCLFMGMPIAYVRFFLKQLEKYLP